MNRIWGSVVSVGSLMVFAGAFAPACNHTDSSIFIENVSAPPPIRTSITSSCASGTPDPTETYLTQGTMDIGLTETYSAILLVGNQLNSQADPESDRTETSRVSLTTASVSLTDATGTKSVGDAFSVTIDDFIDPGGGGVPGYGLVSVPLIAGTSAINALKTKVNARGDNLTVLANVKVYGKTLGEQELVSNTFTFPITVCYGCLVDFPPADDSTAPGFDCANTASGATSSIPCFIGQDQVVTCDQCNGLAVCESPFCPENCSTCSSTVNCTQCASGFTLTPGGTGIASCQ